MDVSNFASCILLMAGFDLTLAGRYNRQKQRLQKKSYLSFIHHCFCCCFFAPIFQVRLHVKDGGRTSLYDTAEMRIAVQRNLQDPVFENSFIFLNITEDFVINGLLTTVTANDADPMVLENILNSVENAEHFY